MIRYPLTQSTEFPMSVEQKLFRPHFGTLDESMAAAFPVEHIVDLINYAEEKYPHMGDGGLSLLAYGFDDRINWMTYMVLYDGAPIGYTNHPLTEHPIWLGGYLVHPSELITKNFTVTIKEEDNADDLVAMINEQSKYYMDGRFRVTEGIHGAPIQYRKVIGAVTKAEKIDSTRVYVTVEFLNLPELRNWFKEPHVELFPEYLDGVKDITNFHK